MKLHLGCGQKYLDGYINIDYPLSEHSVQQTSVADEFANILDLNYPVGFVDEIRLHHLFEHFPRATACAMLAGWNSWLREDGILHIEVPDFERTGRAALSIFSSVKTKAVAMRHIFGSQEMNWAIHFEGYTSTSLSRLLKLYGFKIIQFTNNKYRGTYNLEVIAKKVRSVSREESEHMTENYLYDYLIANVESERILLHTWMNTYTKQIEKTFSKNG